MTSASPPKPDLQDGLNFRVIQGKHANSKLIVQDEFAFVVEKYDTSRASGPVMYIKCRYSSCPARGVIKNNILEIKNVERNEHTCVRTDGASLAKIAVQELLNKMKNRAATEGTTFYVSIIRFQCVSLSIKREAIYYREARFLDKPA